MIEIRLAALVVIWFPKYLLRNKSMIDLKILYASGSATPLYFLLLIIAIHFFIAYWHIHFNCNLSERVDMRIDYHFGAFLHQCVCWFFIANAASYSIWYRDFKIRSHWITYAYCVSTKISEFEFQHFHF